MLTFCSLCVIQQFSFLYILALHYDFSHIEDVHQRHRFRVEFGLVIIILAKSPSSTSVVLPGSVAQSVKCQASDAVYGHSPHFRLIVQEGCCQLQLKVCA